MNLKIRKDEETGESYIDIVDLSEVFEDISAVEYYELTENRDGVITLQFFDKDKTTIIPKLK
jgi:hypothetical protein